MRILSSRMRKRGGTNKKLTQDTGPVQQKNISLCNLSDHSVAKTTNLFLQYMQSSASI